MLGSTLGSIVVEAVPVGLNLPVVKQPPSVPSQRPLAPSPVRSRPDSLTVPHCAASYNEHPADWSPNPTGDRIALFLKSSYTSRLDDHLGRTLVMSNEQEKQPKVDRPRLRFPSYTLGSAVDLAEAVYQQHGTECTLPQLAASVDRSPKASSFRQQVAAARSFGFFQRRSKTVELTDLGQAVNDPDRRVDALVEAFLSVGLFRELYQRYEGNVLPPSAGLEGVLQELGVAAEAARRARRVFHRSAADAGLFAAGSNRLIRPSTSIRPPSEAEAAATPGDAPVTDADASSLTSESVDPVLGALVQKLADKDNFKDVDQRKQWFEIFKLTFEMVYGSLSNGESSQ